VRQNGSVVFIAMPSPAKQQTQQETQMVKIVQSEEVMAQDENVEMEMATLHEAPEAVAEETVVE